jgi:hypothetical protein
MAALHHVHQGPVALSPEGTRQSAEDRLTVNVDDQRILHFGGVHPGPELAGFVRVEGRQRERFAAAVTSAMNILRSRLLSSSA